MFSFYGYDHMGQLTGIVQDTNLLTVMGSLNSTPTNLTINGQAASIYGDLTYAVTNGLNPLTMMANGLLTNRTLEYLPTATSVTV